MRKHGWQLPYHPLQVVAVSVFLALGFAFYVFFAPFVGKKKMYEYIVMGIYTPIIICAFGLYIWCAGADPADTGVFKSRKYRETLDNKRDVRKEGSKIGDESTSSIQDANAPSDDRKSTDSRTKDNKSESKRDASSPSYSKAILALLPCAVMCHCTNQDEGSPELQTSEDGMFYCNLCEVEVYKYSKHCRVCDKCVDRFDHHCRWLNNCIGKKNYKKFFTLMVSALLLAVCTILALIATLPLIQLFFFHVLLIKKGISTYDYIIALREQEQLGYGVPQSPQMSPGSSRTGFSSASSFNTFRQGAWCTPPRLFIEDQYDVVPPETSSVSSYGKKTQDDPIKKKNSTAVKISPWTLARLNAEEVSKAAAEARKRSKILQPVSRKEAGKMGSNRIERDMSFGKSDRHIGSSHRIRLPESKNSSKHWNDIPTDGNLSSLVPLNLEARSVFRAMSTSTGIVGSSPDSSLASPDIQPFMDPSRADTTRMQTDAVVSGRHEKQRIISLTGSMSDGYDASGGEDSDRVPSRLVQRSGNSSARLFDADENDRIARLKMPSTSKISYPNDRKI
ncbi:probable protein S-acyltransferase 22 [Tanacetum coccineum]